MKFGQSILRKSITIVAIRCRTLRYFSLKMHQSRLWHGLRPTSRWGAYSAPREPRAGIR